MLPQPRLQHLHQLGRREANLVTEVLGVLGVVLVAVTTIGPNVLPVEGRSEEGLHLLRVVDDPSFTLPLPGDANLQERQNLGVAPIQDVCVRRVTLQRRPVLVQLARVLHDRGLHRRCTEEARKGGYMLIGILGKAGAGKDSAANVLVERHGFVKVSLADPLKRICREVFDFTEEQLWGPSHKRNEPDTRYVQVKAGSERLVDIQATRGPDGTPSLPVPFEGEEEGFEFFPPENIYGNPNMGRLRLPVRDQFLTPRFALQTLGSEWGRNCYGDIWTEYAIRIAKTLLEGTSGEGTSFEYTSQKGLYLVEGTWRPAGIVVPDVRFRNEVDAIKAAGGVVWKILRPGAGLSGAAAQHVSETEQDSVKDEEFDVIFDNAGTLEDLGRLIDTRFV